MYLDYWQLEAKPFEPVVDARDMFPGPTHVAATHKLRYAIENRRPAALLVGSAGVGKTLIWEALSAQLGEKVGKQAHLAFPLLSTREMLAYLAIHFGGTISGSQASADESLHSIEQVLTENHQRGKLAVLAVDEAHLLEDAGLLDPLRLLMNLRSQGEPLFTLLLIGQVPTLSTMERTNNLDERLEMKVLVKPLTGEETTGYIEHRLVQAGATRPLFTTEALETAHQLSGGIPRRINRLCDLALMVGYAAKDAEIDAPQLRAVNDELVTLRSAA
jgi:type II secretory pathway predicted ATPase ExeA